MTTLVTGIGLVGTSFARCALQRGEPVVFLDLQSRDEYLRERLGPIAADIPTVKADIRDLSALVTAMREHKVETVVHTAGLIGDSVSRPLYTGLEVNVTGTINVLEAVRLARVRRLVHISSFAVYDRRRARGAPITEDAPRGPGRAYGNSKVIKELVAESYQKEFGFELAILRPANAYGYGHFEGGSFGSKIQALLQAGIDGQTAFVKQEHTMDFEYVYDLDVGRAVDLAATVDLPDKPVFNVGTGTITSFDDLVTAARRIVGDLKVQVIPGAPPAVSAGDPLDLSHTEAALGWKPTFDIDAGLSHYAYELRSRNSGGRAG